MSIFSKIWKFLILLPIWFYMKTRISHTWPQETMMNSFHLSKKQKWKLLPVLLKEHKISSLSHLFSDKIFIQERDLNWNQISRLLIFSSMQRLILIYFLFLIILKFILLRLKKENAFLFQRFGGCNREHQVEKRGLILRKMEISKAIQSL